MTLVTLLEQRTGTDGAAPLITYYDEVTGERTELSAVTFENWVAKSANLLRDDLLLEPGAGVHLDLPWHWQTLVLLHAVWRVRGVLDVDGVLPAEVTARSQAALSDGTSTEGDLLVLSLRPLGLPCDVPLPAGAIDYAQEVRLHGDRYDGPLPVDGDAALRGGSVHWTHAELLARARSRAQELPPSPRLLRRAHLLTPHSLVEDWAAVVVAGGSLVLVAGEPDDLRLVGIARSELVSPRPDPQA